jgi:hypothetical protein
MNHRAYQFVALLTSVVAGFLLAQSEYRHEREVPALHGQDSQPNWLGIVGGYFLMGTVVTYSAFVLAGVVLRRVPISEDCGTLSILGSAAYTVLWIIRETAHQHMHLSGWHLYFDNTLDMRMVRGLWITQWAQVALVVVTIFFVRSFVRHANRRSRTWIDVFGYGYSALVILLAIADWFLL